MFKGKPFSDCIAGFLKATIGYMILLVGSLGLIEILAIMGVILGLYWAVGSNLTVGITQELTDGAGFAVAHQQMFGLTLASKAADLMRKKSKAHKGKNKPLEEIELPGFLFHIITVSLQFAVNLAILQLGIRTFVSEVTESFSGISEKILPEGGPRHRRSGHFRFRTA